MIHHFTLRRGTDRLRRTLRAWWRRLGTDELSDYLSRSSDFADLDYRIRRWNENDRRDRMPLL
jgi:hypothetical protein